jgi:hypothetical protein
VLLLMQMRGSRYKEQLSVLSLALGQHIFLIKILRKPNQKPVIRPRTNLDLKKAKLD